MADQEEAMAFLQETENEAMAETSSSRPAGAHMIVTMLLCVLFAVMYLDRINISAAAASIKTHFGFGNAELGWTFSAFSWAYLGSVLLGGWGARRYGARLTLLVCVVVVGLGTIATGIASGVITLFAARLAVGLGEGPAFPAATQAMRNWYPADRFGHIQGITHSASRLGAALAPPIVAVLILWGDWRVSFVICGVAALIWAACWWYFFQDDPRNHPRVDLKSLKGLSVSLPNKRAPMPLGIMTRRMLPVTLVMFAYGWTYWVFVSWLPLYFVNAHGQDLKNSAMLTGALFVAGLIGNTAGGVASDSILRRTGRNRLARCGVMACSLVGSAAFLIPTMLTGNLYAVVPMLAGAMFCLELTIAPVYAVAMDMTKEYAGLASCYVIIGVGLSGIVSPVVFGWLIDRTGNWNVPFAGAVAILLGGALAVVWVRPDKKLIIPEQTDAPLEI
jgi:MFS family permease